MRFSLFSVMVAASVALASPTRFKRGIDSRDVSSDAGSISSSNAAAAGAISPNILCPSADKDGKPLTASSSIEDEGNEFALCTYQDAGQCAFFFADGSFSSGSSTCPKGLPQPAGGAGGGGGGGSTTTSTRTPPPVTTQAPPPPPTTSTTETPPPATTNTPPPPPPTTSSTEISISTSTSVSISTSTSTDVSTVPLSTTSAAPTTPPPAAPTSTDDSDNFTTVIVSETVAPPADPSGVANANSGLGEGQGNGAVPRAMGAGAESVAALAVVLFALL